MNYTYLLRCADATFYCGWTNDLIKRLRAHNSGCGAKYTKPRRPVVLAYYEEFETKEEAMRREAAIKKLSRKEKEALVREGNIRGQACRQAKEEDPRIRTGTGKKAKEQTPGGENSES